MRIKPAIGTVVGNTDANHWGQVLMMPQAYGVVEVASLDGVARTIGVKALSTLTGSFTDSVVSLSGVSHVADALSEESIVTCIVLVPVGPVVYVASRGAGAVYLKRGERVSCLVKNHGEISGEVKKGDSLLLASSGFVAAFSDEELGSLFDHQTPVDVAEKLTLLFHERTEGVGGAALIFQVTDFVDPEPDPVPEVTEVAQPTVPSVVRHDMPSRWSAVRLRAGIWRRRLREHMTGRRKKLFSVKAIIAGVLILTFIISVMIGIWKQQQNSSSESVVAVINQAQYAFDEGVALLELNSVKGRQRLTDAKALLEPLAKTLPPRSKDGRQVAALLTKVTDNLTQALHIVVGEPQLFYDAALLKKDATVGEMSLDGDTLGIVDPVTKTVYQIAVPSKSGQIVAGGESIIGARFIAARGDSIFVLNDKGIITVSVREKKTKETGVKIDSQWGVITGLVSFGGNLYLLDSQKSRIWKYVATDTGFSELREYLNPDSLPDLSAATSMAIDGSVWIGTSDGRVLRFSAGRELTFVPKGVEPIFGRRLMVYTSDALKHVYVLDSDNKRIVVLDKEGMYTAQYSWQGNIAVRQLAVSETLNKVLLLADGKIYQLEMQ
ncbi:hypothetical protein HY948_00040 [Candidatus Gottesmanbacteria bacterium]|nr:hypothetical protein [Candidatus Gottesmanbacteria bacterium]